MRRDTVDSALVTRLPSGRLEFEGYPVQCAGAACEFFAPADPEDALFFAQDVSFTAWGMGVEGLSATFFLRARADIAGEFLWPRYDDAFDAILGYAELARERYRVRLGRQRNLSGLGFTSFDGIGAQFDASDRIRFELYGGRSLARGLESARHDALAAVEDFLPDANAILGGGAAEFDAGRSVSGALRYQIEFWSDGSGIVSERAAFDLRAAELGPIEAEFSADYDVAFNHLGSANLSLRYPLLDRSLILEATARRYRPFFELWTIWGFFSPVGYREAELQAAWRPSQRVDLTVQAGLRNYEETDADAFLVAPEGDTRRLTVRSRVQLPRAIDLDAEYRLEHGFGAFVNSGELTTGWRPHERLRVGTYATAFQQILEFRTGNAIVLGLGAHADARISSRINLAGGITLYRQNIDNRPSGADWNQTRAWAALEFGFGGDPGLAARVP